MTLIIALMLSGGSIGMARDSMFQACVDARLAAQEETSATEWFFTGCMPNGVAAAEDDVPEAPVSALVGKDRDYVDRYIECFQMEARMIRRRWAMVGCCVGFPLQIFTTRR